MYRDGFQDPLSGLIMGETAEVLARQYGITREESDRFALESQQKAEAAQKAGYFTREIAPVAGHPEGHDRRRRHRRASAPWHDASRRWRSCRWYFRRWKVTTGIITAGSSSGITDGGAALVLASDQWAADRGLDADGADLRLGERGRRPADHGHRAGPRDRRSSCERSGLELSDFELVELNEAFAAQVLAVLKDVPIPRDKLNVNGGAIALGHPIGCTGARIVVTLLHEMQRRKCRRRPGDAVRQRRHGDGDGSGDTLRSPNFQFNVVVISG